MNETIVVILWVSFCLLVSVVIWLLNKFTNKTGVRKISPSSITIPAGLSGDDLNRWLLANDLGVSLGKDTLIEQEVPQRLGCFTVLSLRCKKLQPGAYNGDFAFSWSAAWAVNLEQSTAFRLINVTSEDFRANGFRLPTEGFDDSPQDISYGEKALLIVLVEEGMVRLVAGMSKIKHRFLEESKAVDYHPIHNLTWTPPPSETY